jgi:hypothetical protein
VSDDALTVSNEAVVESDGAVVESDGAFVESEQEPIAINGNAFRTEVTHCLPAYAIDFVEHLPCAIVSVADLDRFRNLNL